MNILQKIFLEHYKEMLYTLHPRESVIMAVPCTTALTATNGNLFLFVVIVAFALPVGTCILLTALPLCLFLLLL